MKKLLSQLQIALILITMALIVNFIIESIFELFSFDYNLKYSLAFSALSLLVLSTIIKFWKSKEDVNKG